ncbi:DUF1877 family protein [Streptomyces sp. NPDC051322]|uniref:DUF1877 family protein n=1 Tax=Streptomyces sp. NPDC051322 TaxID=3154645 RepID=UPI00344DFA15
MSRAYHLRSVSAAALTYDPDWLAAQFADDWDDLQSLCAVHLAGVLQQDFADVDRLYTAPGQDRAGSLPVLGGRTVPHHDGRLPPFAVLTPPGVKEAAAFLIGVSFDSLWQAVRTELTAPYGSRVPESEVREHFSRTHEGLAGFYARAAHEERSVVKWLLL